MSSAVMSPDRKYRYVLSRDLEPTLTGEPRTVAWVMLNPSTADATDDDPTIRRVKRFSTDWGYDRCTVVNLFPYRATKPRQLIEAFDAGVDIACAGEFVGILNNDSWLVAQFMDADLVVAAWGATLDAFEHRGPIADLVMDRTAAVFKIAAMTGHDLHCLGTTKGGHPRHPLYVKAATPPELWWVAADPAAEGSAL